VRGSFATIRAALRHFVPQQYGRAIAVSSNFGSVGVAGFATYCMAKAAINNMARSLAVEFGPYGITVNALCPGSTKTSMSAPAHRDPDIAAAFRAATPLALENDDYQAEPDDIAGAAAFLASDDARFLTGEALIVDGGWNAR
jgi:NAD(P)-dependent dehydrogenase (short-subunit alcohol dehydrogenase family)